MQKMLDLLMPGRIEIVVPFTRIRSFEGEATPDGIELFLQAVNSLDNPGLMLYGTVHIELYEYIQASGEPRGRRLEHWNTELNTEADQRTHWNALTQMYEFRLGIDQSKIPLADAYVLAVTYNSPLGEHFMDECVISALAGDMPRDHGRTRNR